MKKFLQSEDWLPLLMRALDLLARPTPHNILAGFEAWEYETHLREQLRLLKHAQLLEVRGSGHRRTLHITPNGRLAESGGVDPTKQWKRVWDGRWRFLLFDLPSRSQSLRVRLWRWLRTSRFGFLQNSVWITPDPISDETLPLRHLKLTPEAFLVCEGRPSGSDTDADLVGGAWDFVTINRHYQTVCNLADEGLKLARAPAARAAELRRWIAKDRTAWWTAVAWDPLLPEALQPAGYLGCQAQTRREAALAALARRHVVDKIV